MFAFQRDWGKQGVISDAIVARGFGAGLRKQRTPWPQPCPRHGPFWAGDRVAEKPAEWHI